MTTQLSHKQISGAPVNAADYGMLPTATAAVNKAALEAAIAVSRFVYIPEGTYSINGDINIRNVSQVICGASQASAYNSSSAATKLIFASGTNGFDLTTTFQEVGDSENSILKNMIIDGNGVVTNLIKFEGTKFFYGLHLTNFTGAGFWGVDSLNSSIIRDCSVFNYDSRGAAGGDANRFVGAGLLTDGTQTTSFQVENCRFRCCQYGLLIRAAQGATFRDCVIESNSAEGLLMEAYDNKGLVRNAFYNCWFENNSEYQAGGTDYSIRIENFATGGTWYANNILFKHCNVSVPATAWQKAVSISANVVNTTFDRCSIGGNGNDSIRVLSAISNNTTFENCVDFSTLNYALDSWDKIRVIDSNQSTLKKSPAGNQVRCVGDISSNFNLPNNTTMTLSTGNTSQSGILNIYVDSAGQGALVYFHRSVTTEIVDPASLVEMSSTPAAGQIGVYSDTSGNVFIKNNVGSDRTVRINIIGAEILSVSDPA